MKKKYLILNVFLIFSGLNLLNSQTFETTQDSLSLEEKEKNLKKLR